jgi:hypothetical protein
MQATLFWACAVAPKRLRRFAHAQNDLIWTAADATELDLATAPNGGSVRVEAQEGRNEGWSITDGRWVRRLSRPAPASSTPVFVCDGEGLRMAWHRMAGQAGQ